MGFAIAVSVLVFSGSTGVLFASNKVIRLKFGHHLPSVVIQAKTLVEYAERVKKATNGRVDITVYGDGSLLRMEDCLSSVESGIADIGFVAFAYETTRLGLNNVMNNVTVNIPTPKDGREIWDQLLAKFPEMREELKGYKFLVRAINTVGINDILTTDKIVRVPDDLKGMKIIATGESAKWIKESGASPLSLGSPDWYMSLERKLGDGVFAPVTVVDSRGCLELTPNITRLSLGRGTYGVIMNLKKWNSLPDDIKNQIEEVNAWLTERYPQTGAEAFLEADAKSKKNGTLIYYPNPEEKKLWRKLGEKSTAEWIEKMESMDKPGKAVFTELKRLTSKFE